MLYLGIDPGLSGGLAWISDDERGVWAVAMPVVKGKRSSLDLPVVRELVLENRPDFVAVERVMPAPAKGRKQGALSMFTFGRGLGQLEGLLAALEIPNELVTPQAWKGVVLAGTAKDKAAAIGWCQRRFPGVSLKATPRCRVNHDGIADALCLAEFARRQASMSEPKE